MKIQMLVVKIADNTVWNVFDTFTTDGTIENTKFLLYDDENESFGWDLASNYTAYNGQQNVDSRTYLPVDLYVVDFMFNGAKILSSIVRYPDKVVKPDDPEIRTGYSFSGWFTDEECTESFDFTSVIVEENTTLYSKEIINSYDVTYDIGDGTGTAPVDLSSPYDYATEVIVLDDSTVTPPEGKVFDNWIYIHDDVIHSFDPADTFLMPEYDIEFVATFVSYYTLSYDAGDGTGTVTDATQYLYGDIATILGSSELTPPEGKEFYEWNTSSDGTGTSKQPDDGLIIVDDITLYAIWVDEV